MQKQQKCLRTGWHAMVGAALLWGMPANAHAAAQAEGQDPEFDSLLALDIDQLTVTSVSRRSERKQDAASAIYVITQEDIHRLGITSIPEALRLAPGVQVARIASNRWAVTARGFNGQFANKLLVLIDGRTIYTPVHSGVYWDDRDVLMEDVERIEVIRGPGASVWGANAVNGVINIITKKAADTQGNFASVAAGNRERIVSARHGGKIDNHTFYRTYAKYLERGPLELASGADGPEDWNRTRAGFRIDGSPDARNDYTVEGDAYTGEQDATRTHIVATPPYNISEPSEDDSFGGNLLGRWKRTLNDGSHATFQTYIDHYTRNEVEAQQNVTTLDADFQHDIPLSDRDTLVWGAGYRYTRQVIDSSDFIRFDQESRGYDIFSAFAQNEYALVPDTVFLTLGSKFEHNDFTGYEVQPTARMSWRVNPTNTLWTAVSRAVRVPSAIEDDFDYQAQIVPGAPNRRLDIVGNKDLEPEELIAYEIGHRWQATPRLSFDTSLFYNDYDQLVTYKQSRPPFLSGGYLVVPYSFENLGSGRTFGGELAADWKVTNTWRLSGSYSYIDVNLDTEAGAISLRSTQESTPHHQFKLQSYLDLPRDWSLNTALYYVDDIHPGSVPIKANLRHDIRIAWHGIAGLELSVTGTDLFNAPHPEFNGAPQEEVGPAYLLRADWKF